MKKGEEWRLCRLLRVANWDMPDKATEDNGKERRWLASKRWGVNTPGVIKSQQTVRTTAGLIPASSWLRHNDDRYAFEGLHHKKDCTTGTHLCPAHPPLTFRLRQELMPPSTPLELTRHKQARSEREAERRDLNQRAKQPRRQQDYAADFGLFVPDAEIDKHLILRRQESTRLDGLWEQAFKKGCPVSNRAPLQAYMDAAEENFWTDVAATWRRSSGSWGSGCMKSVGSTLSLWVIRGRRPRHKVASRANIAPESNFRSTLEDATVTLTYLNSDYRKPSSVRCRRKYLKHKLLVIELAVMQAAAEVEARQGSCSYAIQGSQNGKLLTPKTIPSEQVLHYLPTRGNGTWDMGRPGKNMMGRPTLWDKLRWDDPYNLCFSVV
ncbi:hypothetical protein B0H14DRAFT_2600765 [Mycena olivaceomarginata]|nr:hypothetical protein B0H14DRAFT_2600765 [Mycena olivaceomarginata]